jgi:hypothetical protein
MKRHESVMDVSGERAPISGTVRQPTVTLKKSQSELMFSATSMTHFNVLIGVWCLALFFATSAFGQGYSINWHKIAGGGGTSTNGQYALSGTIGQHDAGGPMSGGSYSMTGGFWAFISVVQTPGAPILYISHSGTTVTVYWQNVSGWLLQQNSSLSAPAGWAQNDSWTTSNGTNYLNLTSPTGNMFFRLKSQ